MTLTITVAAAWGVWQSADRRLTRSGVALPDPSIKQVGVVCSDGSITVAYAGFGRILHRRRHEIDLSDWLRRFLRGKQRTVDQTIDHVYEMSRRYLEPLARRERPPLGHIFTLGVVPQGRQPEVVVITNAPMTPGPNFSLPARVELSIFDLPRPHRAVVVMGSGSWSVDTADRAVLDRVRDFPPRNPEDYRTVLVDVNRRAAARSSGTVSEECTSCFVDPRRRAAPQTCMHGSFPGGPMMIPVISHGIDTSEHTEHLLRLGRPGTWDMSPEAEERRREEARDAGIRAITSEE